MKGYFIALVTLLLFTILLRSAGEAAVAREQFRAITLSAFPMEKIGYIAEDISRDLQRLTAISFNASNTSTRITVIENLSINKSIFFQSYTAFLTNYSNATATNISFSYGDPLTAFIPGNLQYSSNFNNRSFFFRNTTGASGVSEYRITLISSTNYTNITEPSWMVSGTYLVINYTDPVKTYNQAGYVNGSVLNTLDIQYPGGEHVYVYVGPVAGQANALQINQSTLSPLASINMTAVFPYSLALKGTWSCGLNITLPTANYTASVPVD